MDQKTPEIVNVNVHGDESPDTERTAKPAGVYTQSQTLKCQKIVLSGKR